jgi:nucleotide-binding universal stress UspA family protein
MNPIRSILVHFDAAPSSASRLHIARDIAARHESLVTALYAATPGLPPGPFANDPAPAGATPHRARDSEHRQHAKACFDAALRTRGGDATWAELADGPLINAFVQEALCSDLLVLGQRPAGDIFSRDAPADFAEAVMLASGKPAIVVPHAGEFWSVGRRVVVAWKSSRESARAVTCALPLLQRADRVHLAHWSEPGGESHSPLGIERYLRQHNVEPIRHDFDRSHGKVGDAMLAFAADAGADLLVMGCYGHSRVRELVLGGATREVLQTSTLPVFMVH